VDQAAPSNQGILWDKPECREDSNLDCHHHIYALIAIIKKELGLSVSLRFRHWGAVVMSRAENGLAG